jgi:hypothetical protein
MAKRVVTTYVCDLCGADLGDDHEQFIFGVAGVLYSLDLCRADAVATRAQAERWASSGSSAGRYRSFGEPQLLPRVDPPVAKRPERSPFELAAIRRWAREQGMPVSERGRIARPIVEQFDAARAELAALAERASTDATDS